MVELAVQVLAAVLPDPTRPAQPRGRTRHHGVLSAREQEVLRLVAEGRSNQEIAARLYITERTVRYHLSSVFNKLGADNRTQAVTLAHAQSLL
jgi:NarL family two-component system response regulator LiaR